MVLSPIHTGSRTGSRSTRIARRASLAGLFAVVLLASQLIGTSAQAGLSPGAIGIGDPYFPTQGNGGYQVENYDISVRYDPTQTVMYGETTITAVTTEHLSNFFLDFNGMTVRSVTIDGGIAGFSRMDQDLQLSFSFGKPAGTRFVVKIVYDGTPVSAVNRYDYASTGWMRTMDGIVVASQPNGASKWFPSNNHPSDKATFAITMTVPPGVSAVSNGLPGPTTVGADGWASTTWKTIEPMATYLATVAIGAYAVTKTETASGLPIITAVGDLRAHDSEELDRLGEVIEFLENYLGPYPNETAGAIVASDNLGYALETQTRPVYSGQFFLGADNPQATMVMAHEEAHQWFGDRANLAGWKDIWLNEGFASYMDWLWTEHEGYESTDQAFQRLACRPNGSDWKTPGDPGPDSMFEHFVYDRGAMTLHVLRRTIGDPAFFAVLNQWAAVGDGSPRTTAQFITLAESVSGTQLDSLFQTWLYTYGKPAELTCSSISAPSAPTNVTIIPQTETSPATVAWKTPESNGGAYISGYTVAATDTADGSTTTVAETDTYGRTRSLTTLAANHTYTVSVTAKNSAGTSAAATSVFSPALPLPGAPTKVTAVAAGSVAAPQLLLSWSAPEVELETNPVTGYRVTRDGVDAAGATFAPIVLGPSARSLYFSGLPLNTTFHLSVQAIGAPGAGPVVTATGNTFTGGVSASVPLITGTAMAGSTLTAVPGTWGPAPVTLAYQWSVGGVLLAGTKATTYTIKTDDIGKRIILTVRGTKTNYAPAARSSAPTSAVVGLPLTTATPTVSGTLKVGSVLTASAGTWGPAPVVLRYQWKAAGAPIPDAFASTYTPTLAQVGKRISVSVTGTKPGYASTTKTSVSSLLVPPLPLTVTPTPTISGTVKAGSPLTAVPGTWKPSPDTFRYQWNLNGVALAGATSSLFTPLASYVGKTITVTVTGVKAGYTSVTKTSAATVALPVSTFTSTPVPLILGPVAQRSTLTAEPGTWAPTGITLSFQWSANGSQIAGATGRSYQLTSAEAGKTVTVTVRGTKTGYTPVAKTSAPTIAVPRGLG